MVEMFLNETPIELDKMIRLFNEGNFTQLKTLAHSFKPKFTYLGMPQFSEIAKQIENLSVDAKNEEEINNLITELNSEIEMAYKELSDFLTSL
jgi:HPt (histidine-containing phosphotransfer) domain-containing protein